MNPHHALRKPAPIAARFSLSAFGLLMFMTISAWNSTEAATRVWKGGAETTQWSLPANWENGVPEPGDSLQFNKHPLGFTVSAINDLTNISIAKITSEAQGYTITGGDLHLTEGVEVNATNPNGSLNFSCPLHFIGSNIQLVATSGNGIGLQGTQLFAEPTTRVIVQGQISFRPAPGSSYRATTEIRTGNVALVNAPLSVGGPLILGGGETGAGLVLQSNFLLFNQPTLSILKNGILNNIATLNTVGPLRVSEGRIILGGTSPNGRISVVGDALFENNAQIIANAFSSGIPGELSITGRVAITSCTLLVQTSVQLTNSSIILRNDGTDPVVGSFTGLPEGAVFAVGNKVLGITYRGGDGNDVALIPRGSVVLESITPSLSTVGAYLLRGTTATNVVVAIESTDALLGSGPQSWTKVGETLSDLNQGRFDFLDATAPANVSLHRFYRAVVP